MASAAAWRGRALCRPRDKQRGQALIYGIFVLLVSLATLLFLFNTGQLVREKTKLVNTADAVAYSAGVLHARALNFEGAATEGRRLRGLAPSRLHAGWRAARMCKLIHFYTHHAHQHRD